MQGTYRLKSQFLRSLEVEQWPFYTDAQKQMLKRLDSCCYDFQKNTHNSFRSKCVSGVGDTTSTVHDGASASSSKVRNAICVNEICSASVKRPDAEKSYEVASKKLKLSESVLTTSSGTRPTKETEDCDVDSAPYAVHVKPVDVKPVDVPSAVQALQPASVRHSALYVDDQERETKQEYDNTSTNNRHASKDKVKKKKKKKKKEDIEVVTTDPTSTTSTPDHLR